MDTFTVSVKVEPYSKYFHKGNTKTFVKKVFVTRKVHFRCERWRVRSWDKTTVLIQIRVLQIVTDDTGRSVIRPKSAGSVQDSSVVVHSTRGVKSAFSHKMGKVKEGHIYQEPVKKGTFDLTLSSPWPHVLCTALFGGGNIYQRYRGLKYTLSNKWIKAEFSRI